jgi:hypothetical protein
VKLKIFSRLIIGLKACGNAGPAPGCSIAPDSVDASSTPSAEDREVFAGVVKTVEKLLLKATKGSGAGNMDSKDVEPDTAFED